MESMKCEVCFHPFSIIKHRPRCLACGHSFCSPCLKKIVNNNIITCPTCRQFYEIDHLEQIPINYSVEKLLRIDYGVKLFSEIEAGNGEEYMETPMNFNKERREDFLNVNVSDTETNDCLCRISNPSSENSAMCEAWWLGKNDGTSDISNPRCESLTTGDVLTTSDVWWLGKNKGRSHSPVNHRKYSHDFDYLDTKYMNPEMHCRNHKEDIELYCLNHKEWICKKCTEEHHLKVECTIITKEEEKRGRKLENHSKDSSNNSNKIWWLGKELPNNANEEKDQIYPRKISSNKNEMVPSCKIHKGISIYFCLSHQEWVCHLCTLVTHPKHECTVITKDEELKGRKLKFYELNSETNCLNHNKEIVLYCLNHGKWICRKCTNVDHPKHECSVISKEEELRGRKIETEEKIKNCIIKYEKLISNLHKYFISNEKRKNINVKLCNNEVKHKDSVLKNILAQAEEKKWSLVLTLEILCMGGSCSEVCDEYNNITELLTTMVNWEQQQQHWLAQQDKHVDRICYKGEESESLITENDRNKEEFNTALESSQIKLQVSEELQLSLKQQLLEMHIYTEKLRKKMRNVFLWCFIICFSVIIVSLWFIGNCNFERVINDSQNIEVILQKQKLPQRTNEKKCMNNLNKNNSISILKLERHLTDSLDQKYELHMKYDKAISQFNDFQLKMKEVLAERNEIIKKLKISNSETNEANPRERLSFDYSFIKNYLLQVNYILSVIYDGFYWALCLNLSFTSFFIAVYVSFSLDNWLGFLNRKNYMGKFSYFLFIFQVYVTFCEVNSFLPWITGIESNLSTSSLISMCSNSELSSWLQYFVTLLTGAVATGISALLADGCGKKMKSAGYHTDYCHFTVVVTWFLLLKEFSMVISWIEGTTVY